MSKLERLASQIQDLTRGDLKELRTKLNGNSPAGLRDLIGTRELSLLGKEINSKRLQFVGKKFVEKKAILLTENMFLRGLKLSYSKNEMTQNLGEALLRTVLHPSLKNKVLDLTKPSLSWAKLGPDSVGLPITLLGESIRFFATDSGYTGAIYRPKPESREARLLNEVVNKIRPIHGQIVNSGVMGIAVHERFLDETFSFGIAEDILTTEKVLREIPQGVSLNKLHAKVGLILRSGVI